MSIRITALPDEAAAGGTGTAAGGPAFQLKTALIDGQACAYLVCLVCLACPQAAQEGQPADMLTRLWLSHDLVAGPFLAADLAALSRLAAGHHCAAEVSS